MTLTVGHTWDDLAEAVLTHDLAAQRADWQPGPEPVLVAARPVPAATAAEPGLYLVQVDHVLYERKDGTPFTLVEAMREIAGTGNARVRRLDGTVVVAHAGSTAAPWVHVPTGRLVHHRPAWHARLNHRSGA